MKKFLFTAVLAFPFFLGAQQTIDFEDLSLSVDTFYNGADMNGGFNSNNTHFSNVYDQTYSMWSSGFAYSNMRDDSTAGFTNLYSAFPASGANGSANYALFTPGFALVDSITFPQAMTIKSLDVANTTYAYLSMRDGDAYGKEFGSDKNAAGAVDGTDGKDYFFVRVYASYGNTIDSVDIYLADFRSANASDHYILDTWKSTTTNFIADKVTFKLFSSDNGTYGMNTPAYFALDNIKYEPHNVGLKNLTAQKISVYPNPAKDVLNVENFSGIVYIYGMDGSLTKSVKVSESNPSIQISDLKSGVYQLVTSNGNYRFVKE